VTVPLLISESFRSSLFLNQRFRIHGVRGTGYGVRSTEYCIHHCIQIPGYGILEVLSPPVRLPVPFRLPASRLLDLEATPESRYGSDWRDYSSPGANGVISPTSPHFSHSTPFSDSPLDSVVSLLYPLVSSCVLRPASCGLHPVCTSTYLVSFTFQLGIRSTAYIYPTYSISTYQPPTLPYHQQPEKYLLIHTPETEPSPQRASLPACQLHYSSVLRTPSSE
jgi:hypothetical protein